MYWVFHINDKPEGKFLYTETIKLSTINRVLSACICMQKDHLHTVRVLQLLSEFSGLWKWLNYVCCDKTLVMTSILLSWQMCVLTNVCLDKTCLLSLQKYATNMWQTEFCCSKSFVMTSVLFVMTKDMFYHDKHMFVVTNVCLSWQKLHLWQLPLMIVNLPDPIHVQSRSDRKYWSKTGWIIFAYQLASGPDPLGESLIQSARTKSDLGWFSHCEPGHPWKNVTEFESGKLVAGQLDSATNWAQWFLHTGVLPDQMSLSKTWPGHPDWIQASFAQEWNWTKCEKLDPADPVYTVWPNSGCTLAIMAQTSCNENASESDPACLLGFFRMKLDTIKKKKALWCVMSSSLLLLGGDRVVCHVFIIVVTGWLQGGVSCLHHCCYWVAQDKVRQDVQEAI